MNHLCLNCKRTTRIPIPFPLSMCPGEPEVCPGSSSVTRFLCRQAVVGLYNPLTNRTWKTGHEAHPYHLLPCKFWCFWGFVPWPSAGCGKLLLDGWSVDPLSDWPTPHLALESGGVDLAVPRAEPPLPGSLACLVCPYTPTTNRALFSFSFGAP